MKSLVESIFDQNTVAKSGDICLGDIYELDEWTVPGKNESRDVDIVNGTYFLSNVAYELDKNSWCKFLKPIKPFKHKITQDVLTYHYIYSPALYALTWIVLSCSSVEEIKKRTERFLKNVSADVVKRMQHPLNSDLKKKVVYRTETQILNGVGNQKDDIRMVVFKFFTFDRESDVIVCMTLKKRD